jgi:hypothetical protein
MEINELKNRSTGKEVESMEIKWEQLDQAVESLLALLGSEPTDSEEYPTAEMFWVMPAANWK